MLSPRERHLRKVFFDSFVPLGFGACLPSVADVTSGVLNSKLKFLSVFCSSFQRLNERSGKKASKP